MFSVEKEVDSLRLGARIQKFYDALHEILNEDVSQVSSEDLIFHLGELYQKTFADILSA